MATYNFLPPSICICYSPVFRVFHLHSNFRIIFFFTSVKTSTGTLLGIALNLQMALGHLDILMLIFLFHEQGIILHLVVSMGERYSL